jgi:hypothetical protein
MRVTALNIVVLLFLLLFSWRAEAAVERYAVIVGNNRGLPGEIELRYAENDAQRMYDVLKDLGGFAPANMVLLRGENASTFTRTLSTVNDLIRSSLSRPNTQAVLFVYYSGHANADALHLGATRFDLVQLEQLVRASPATFRILTLDACRSGVVTRRKGGAPGPQFSVKLEEQLDEQGVVFLTATAASEDAQESDELKASFFTHYLHSALVGAADTDGDGRITLEEAYRYAHDNTVRATSRTLAGIQHPSYRYDLRGQGKVVLTELGANAATRGFLAFPSGRTYLVTRGDRAGAIVGEVATGSTARRLSVRPGRYFVQGRATNHLLEGTVTVGAGQSLEVSDRILRRVEYARLVRKGGTDVRVTQGPQAGYAFRTAIANGKGLCHGGVIGWPIVFSALSLTPRVFGCVGEFENPNLKATSSELGTEIRLAHSFDLPTITLGIGVGAGASWLHQSFETSGNAPSRSSAAGHVGVAIGGEVDLSGGFYLFFEEAAETYILRIRETRTRDESWRASFAFRQLVGLGKTF